MNWELAGSSLNEFAIVIVVNSFYRNLWKLSFANNYPQKKKKEGSQNIEP